MDFRLQNKNGSIENGMCQAETFAKQCIWGLIFSFFRASATGTEKSAEGSIGGKYGTVYDKRW